MLKILSKELNKILRLYFMGYKPLYTAVINVLNSYLRGCELSQIVFENHHKS